MGKDEDIVDLVFLKSCLPNQGSGGDSEAVADQLKREIRSLKLQLHEDESLTFAQTHKLKGQITDAEHEKRELQLKVNKLEA